MNLSMLDQIAKKFTFMPDEKEGELGSDFDLFYKEINPIKGVTFYGGSFNPFHRGHLECLLKCPEENLILIPDINPQKPEDLSMSITHLESLAEELKATPYLIYPRFILNAKKNPTSSWISKIRHFEVNFLMGDDSYMNLLKWIKPEEILLSLTKLYVVSREYKTHDYLIQKEEILKINPKLEIIFLGEHDYMDLSSTKLRK